MTQLEEILKHIVFLAKITPDKSDDLKKIVSCIESGEITAESLIADHKSHYGFFCGNWHINDIIGHAKEMDDIDLSDEEAKEISLRIERSHDASIGVNWDVIIDHVRMWQEDQK